MNDEIKNIARKIERTICPGCLRRKDERLCITCPVAELVDICRDDGLVKRTLISRQMFEYLCDLGVVTTKSLPGYDEPVFDLVKYPDGMSYCSLLNGKMKEDLLKDTPWSIRFNIETHESPDTEIEWAVPQWLFAENQMKVLTAYFGRKE